MPRACVVKELACVPDVPEAGGEGSLDGAAEEVDGMIFEGVLIAGHAFFLLFFCFISWILVLLDLHLGRDTAW